MASILVAVSLSGEGRSWSASRRNRATRSAAGCTALRPRDPLPCARYVTRADDGFDRRGVLLADQPGAVRVVERLQARHLLGREVVDLVPRQRVRRPPRAVDRRGAGVLPVHGTYSRPPGHAGVGTLNGALYGAGVGVRGLGDAFRVVMRRHGWTGAHLARQLGTSQPWVSMVLSGRRDPGMRRSAEMLARLGWDLQLVPSGEEDPVKRREFLAGAAAAMFVPAPSASPYTDADYVSALTARLAHHEGQVGGAPLAREALRHAARVVPGLRGKDRRLDAAAAGLCRQAALILHDVRNLAQAERLAGLALRFARRAGDPTAQLHAYDTLALTSAYTPDGRGVAYARRGLALGGTSDADRAVLAARLGRTLALVPTGQYDARRYLDESLDLAAGGSQLTGEIHGNAGIGLTDLGLPAASRHLENAVELTTAEPFVQSLYLARQAKMAIRARKPDAAAPVMRTLAGVIPLVDSPRLIIHVRHILDGTGRWAGIPDMRHTREAMREAARGR